MGTFYVNSERNCIRFESHRNGIAPSIQHGYDNRDR